MAGGRKPWRFHARWLHGSARLRVRQFRHGRTRLGAGLILATSAAVFRGGDVDLADLGFSSCQIAQSQHDNKEKAFQLLTKKIYYQQQSEQKQKQNQIKK
ncbi:MAG: hypothetical protein Q8761_03140, partial [Sweet potato little leaf phytoplasma]|nr:hypothetical protein [Sweet potato little leaf phytoplasma]